MSGFIKYPKIKVLGDRENEGIITTPGRLVIQEKIDGANFGFYMDGSVLHFCSHNKYLTNTVQIAETGVPNSWKGIQPVIDAFEKHPDMFDEGIYVYGESTQKHRLKYDDIPGFIGFDVLHIDTGMFMHWQHAEAWFDGVELPYANVICDLRVPDDIPPGKDVIVYLRTLYSKSAYRDDGAEGIVMKRFDTQQFAKIVDSRFGEKVRKPRAIVDSDNERWVSDTYATPARIEKMVYKLRDDGHELGMTMIWTLSVAVIDDIMEEEGKGIRSDLPPLKMRKLGSIVATKCLAVLEKVIMVQSYRRGI